MKLYDNPANLFVAKFLGTANILEGEVEGHTRGVRFRSDNGASLSLNSGHRQGRGSIVFRPQNVEIIKPGSHEGADHNRITGSVCHMEFLGSVIRYGVDIGKDVVLIDHPHKQGESTFALSSKVDLLVDRDGIQVVA